MRYLNRIYNQIKPIEDKGHCLSAGTTGKDFSDCLDTTEVLLYSDHTDKNADEIFTVSGDSMEPQFHDSDKVLVQYCPEIKYGDIGAFYVPGIGGVIKQ